MNVKEQWEIILSTNQYPCFVAESDTYAIVYANDEYVKLLGAADKVVGKKFYEIIPNDNVQNFEEIQLDWKNHHVIERIVTNKRMNLNFKAILTYLRQENLVFCILHSSEESGEVLSDFEKAMTRCTDIFAQPTETTLLSFMELLCDFYQSERAYVYRFNMENNTINCISQWTDDPDYRVIEEVGTKMDATFLMNWIQKENVGGIVMADSENPVFDHESTLAKILETFQINNITLCTVEDANQKVVGVVGLSNRKNFQNIFDRRLVHTISRFVAQGVTKNIVDATLFEAHHRDVMTGLYNRVGYSRKVDKLKENPPKTLGVLSINVNGLKDINHNFGNAEGDKHIKKAARRLKNHFGFDIFRISGDEFIGLDYGVAEDTFENKVNELHEAMRAEKDEIFSMGHSWGKGNYDISRLVLEADTVMYINKQEYYHTTERHFEHVRDNILSDLLESLENDEFMVYLQPQVILEDGSLHGAEALIRRYDKKNQKMVFPDQFISLYEQKSVIRHVDIFVIESVCQRLQQWVREGKGIPVSVNLSRITLQEYGIVDTIVEICDRYQVPHHLLVIEVTERVGLIENNVASSLIQQFKENGFHISLDDFGCAYSNIVTLAQIEVDEVKIDKSLVDFIITSSKNRVLVKNVLAMCNELEGASTLAEGIEDEEQAKLLQKLGCRLGQGYYYSRPIPTEEFEEKYIFL